ncbi:polyamine aminopropyltransferase [Psychrosphaera ytuae]|uniref:Polyamine aminopropyltransferase n=1 Tax=Psychrosphaera ytuae TaxID=2820710 RepID=A0A975DED9_9GAMM|nr:polyamine aminopropyltransferase [Psychrosphaera ytuae]QTH65373.1 polyamine aminopropyltransferase [Psychrosphaera ytuae]
MNDEWCNEINNGAAFGLKIKRKLASKQSDFQLVEMYETEEFGNLMMLDGCTMVSSRENFLYHEMMSHPALFSHPNPKNVVIIGGGDCGTLREVLRHKGVESVHQIDIDKVVTEMAELYFPELCEKNNDPRAHILFDDGIKFMADAADESIDIIIVDSTDPVGPGEGLFNHAFYTNCLRALRKDGVFVQQSESPLLHLPLLMDMRQAMLDVGFSDLKHVNFPQMIYPSGWWSGTMAKKSGQFDGFREADAAELAAEGDLQYYNAEMHKASQALPNFLAKAFKDQTAK